MRQVYDRETGNELTVTDAWLARNRRLVSIKPAGATTPQRKSAKPKAPRKRATSATETAAAVENTSALPDTNE